MNMERNHFWKLMIPKAMDSWKRKICEIQLNLQKIENQMSSINEYWISAFELRFLAMTSLWYLYPRNIGCWSFLFRTYIYEAQMKVNIKIVNNGSLRTPTRNHFQITGGSGLRRYMSLKLRYVRKRNKILAPEGILQIFVCDRSILVCNYHIVPDACLVFICILSWCVLLIFLWALILKVPL
jgi:hypothetical protein